LPRPGRITFAAKQKNAARFHERRLSLTERDRDSAAAFGLLMPNPHAEAPTVVSIVVIVHREKQPPLSRDVVSQLGADEKWLARLAVRGADIADQSADPGSGYRSRADDRAEPWRASAFRSNLAG